MPFTLAHPAAVLPLRRTKLVLSALVVGSMAPDFPYFATLRDEVRWGHSWKGVVLFCLPAGLAVLWLFHAVVKRPLISLAPEFMRKRVSEENLHFRFGPLRRFLLIVVSLLIGTLTHILWDGFTHEHGIFVKHWPALSTKVMLHHLLPLWKALQLLCSVGGFATVAVIAIWWWYRKPVVAQPVPATISPRLRWWMLACGAALACAAGVIGAYPFLRVTHFLRAGHWKPAVVPTAIYMIAATVAEIFIFSLAWHALHFARGKQRPLDADVQRLDATVER